MAATSELVIECNKLPAAISAASVAIVQYVSSTYGEEWVSSESGRWRLAKSNFVTVKPQWKRAGSLAVTLRGNPHEFEQGSELELVKDQNGYSAFKLERPQQIAEAFAYLRRAENLFERGRTRVQVTPTVLG